MTFLKIFLLVFSKNILKNVDFVWKFSCTKNITGFKCFEKSIYRNDQSRWKKRCLFKSSSDFDFFNRGPMSYISIFLAPKFPELAFYPLKRIKLWKFWHTTVVFYPDYQNIRLQLCFSNIRSTVSLLDSKINSGCQTSISPLVCPTSKINIEACVVEYWLIASKHQSSTQSTSSMAMWTWKYFNLIKFRFLPMIKVDESVSLFTPASEAFER